MVDGVRILVGDDDRVNQLVLQGMLKRLGYGCTVVGTGTEVVEAVTQESFDVLFLDVQLPDIDGFEVVRKTPHLAPPSPIESQPHHDRIQKRSSWFQGRVAVLEFFERLRSHRYRVIAHRETTHQKILG